MSSFPYRTQAVRDLAWACFSPPLLRASKLPGSGVDVVDCQPRLTSSRLDWLAQLDIDPQPLLAHLARNSSHRLGVYFEKLWHFFLREDAATIWQCGMAAPRSENSILSTGAVNDSSTATWNWPSNISWARASAPQTNPQAAGANGWDPIPGTASI